MLPLYAALGENSALSMPIFSCSSSTRRKPPTLRGTNMMREKIAVQTGITTTPANCATMLSPNEMPGPYNSSEPKPRGPAMSKIGTAMTPQIPQAPWTGNASTGSSILRIWRSSDAPQ